MSERMEKIGGLLITCVVAAAVMIGASHLAREMGLTGMTDNVRALIEKVTRDRQEATKAYRDLAEQFCLSNEAHDRKEDQHAN